MKKYLITLNLFLVFILPLKVFADSHCGDGAVDTNLSEECDDGNTVSNDGCSENCKIERCGDIIVQSALGEECDDGNGEDKDECDNNCRLNRDYYCGEPSLGVLAVDMLCISNDIDTPGLSGACYSHEGSNGTPERHVTIRNYPSTHLVLGSDEGNAVFTVDKYLKMLPQDAILPLPAMPGADLFGVLSPSFVTEMTSEFVQVIANNMDDPNEGNCHEQIDNDDEGALTLTVDGSLIKITGDPGSALELELNGNINLTSPATIFMYVDKPYVYLNSDFCPYDRTTFPITFIAAGNGELKTIEYRDTNADHKREFDLTTIASIPVPNPFNPIGSIARKNTSEIFILNQVDSNSDDVLDRGELLIYKDGVVTKFSDLAYLPSGAIWLFKDHFEDREGEYETLVIAEGGVNSKLHMYKTAQLATGLLIPTELTALVGGVLTDQATMVLDLDEFSNPASAYLVPRMCAKDVNGCRNNRYDETEACDVLQDGSTHGRYYDDHAGVSRYNCDANTCVEHYCGDGILRADLGEQCDDANTADGDACTSTCAIDNCPSDSAKTEPGICGCGVVDDFNDVDNDGIYDCQNDTDDCVGVASPGNVPLCRTLTCVNDSWVESATPNCEACGNGFKEGSEECDDGNVTDGDGCTSTCTNQVDPNCAGKTPPTLVACQQAVCSNNTWSVESISGCSACGNGIIETGEECDDSNNQNGDSCNSTCQNDACPNDNFKTAPGVCGCGVSDVDTDSDGEANCVDTNDCLGVSAPILGECEVASCVNDTWITSAKPDCTITPPGFDGQIGETDAPIDQEGSPAVVPAAPKAPGVYVQGSGRSCSLSVGSTESAGSLVVYLLAGLMWVAGVGVARSRKSTLYRKSALASLK